MVGHTVIGSLLSLIFVQHIGIFNLKKYSFYPDPTKNTTIDLLSGVKYLNFIFQITKFLSSKDIYRKVG